MSKAEQFELEYNLFSSLSGLFNGKKSPLSPLGSSEFKPLTPDIREKLSESKILDEQGQPLKNFTPVLDILGQAEAYGRLRFIGAAKFIDYAVYFYHGNRAALSAAPTGLVINLPAKAEEVIKDLKLYLGETNVQNSNFEAHVSIDEAIVLAAMIDLRRSAFLRALSDYVPVSPAPVNTQLITRIIASGLDQSQWLSGMLRVLCSMQTPLPASQVQEALTNLATKGLLAQSDSGFALNEFAAYLADRLLVINNVIWLEVAHANLQDKVAFANMVCCQAGLNDLFCIRFDGLQVFLHASSPENLLEKIKQHLNDPEILPAPPLLQTTLKLAMMSGPAAGQSYTLKTLTTLGREAECDIQVKDTKISRKHAQIRKIQDGYEITDLGSTNGTYVNGVAITAPVMITESDILTLGETRLTLVRVVENSAPVASEATVYAGSSDLPLAGVELAPVEPKAEVVKPRKSGKTGPFVSTTEQPLLAPQAEVLAPPVVQIVPPPVVEIVPPPVVEIVPPPSLVSANICSTCGNEVSPGARFCGTCGQAL